VEKAQKAHKQPPKSRRTPSSKKPVTVERSLYSKREAAAILGISTRTFERIVSGGDLQPIKLTAGTFRYKRSDLEQYIEKREYGRGEFLSR